MKQFDLPSFEKICSFLYSRTVTLSPLFPLCYSFEFTQLSFFEPLLFFFFTFSRSRMCNVLWSEGCRSRKNCEGRVENLRKEDRVCLKEKFFQHLFQTKILFRRTKNGLNVRYCLCSSNSSLFERYACKKSKEG